MDSTFEDSIQEDAQNNKSDVIKPINRETVHRICSGQVVLSLAIAVKELIENSIDAGAKNIEVKLKDYGMELVEVIDNGSGVRKENFAALTLKHYTSKIRQFDDLETVATLGFRGEALSSLCALCDLTVVTRHISADHAVKIQYDHGGKIVSETPVARSPGTTVQLSKLFVPLPVRRKEFTKNHKREFNKMCTLLYAYCLVAKDVKFTCSNQTSQGSNNKIVSTQGQNSIKDNIISVFGPKQISTLIELELKRPDETILAEYNLKPSHDDPEKPFDFEFDAYISSVIHGNGRSSTDRQFYYINSRPCEPTKVSKLVNEIYRQYNPNQYPFVFFNIKVGSSTVDVNVTPDKRQIFLEKEKLLLATVKSTLIEAFKDFPSTYKMQNTTLSSDSGKKRTLEKSPGSGFNVFRKKIKGEEQRQCSLEDFKFKSEPRENKIDLLPTPEINAKIEQNSSFLLKFAKGKTLDLSALKSNPDFKSESNHKIDCDGENSANFNLKNDSRSPNALKLETNEKLRLSINESMKSEINDKLKLSINKSLRSETSIKLELSLNETNDKLGQNINESLVSETNDKLSPNTNNSLRLDGGDGLKLSAENIVGLERNNSSRLNINESYSSDSLKLETNRNADVTIEEEIIQCTQIIPMEINKSMEIEASAESSFEEETISCRIPSKKKTQDDSNEISLGKYRRHRKRTVLDVTLDDIQLSMQSVELKNMQRSELSLKFRSEISPAANEKAEAELKKQFSKDMFGEMKIIGQFNYAFIIAALERDLFIIDQHASDEKYNFEDLQRTTVLDSQPLVNPKDLQLTAANEIVLMENLDVFKKNGFYFQIDENAEATKKVKLTKIPVSKSYIFGKDDIEEMLYMLQEGFNDNCRPTRVRGMFASRACRKSVMVGKPLTKTDMRRLVDHMGQIDQPWNCPHGRPTMRHLINLDLLHKD